MSLPRWTAPVLLCALPALAQFPFIRAFGVDVPFHDQWAFASTLQRLQEGHWGVLFEQHNEHRILFPRLFFLALVPFSGWDLVVEMYASALIQSVTLWGLFLIYRRACGDTLWGFVPVAFLHFSLGQWQNILSGWQAATYLAVAGSVWAFVFLGRTRLGAAMAAGILASFSLSNGLLVWPLGLALLAWQRAARRALVAWGLMGAMVLALYFWSYMRPGQVPPWTSALRARSVSYFLAALGSPLGAGHVWPSIVAGVALYIAGGVLIGWLRGDVQRHELAPCLGLLAFSTASVVMITLGRATSGLEHAVFSKYTTVSALGFVAIYMLALRRWHREERSWGLLAGVIGACAVGLVAANAWGLKEARGMRAERCRFKALVQTLDDQPDALLGALVQDPAGLRQNARFLAERRLSAFGDPREVVLLFRWQEGVPATEVLPERPITQSMVCPVTALGEVGVQVATWGGRSAATSILSVAVDGVAIASRTVGARTLTDAGWFTVTVEPPVPCRGRTLIVTLRSPDAQPGTGLTAWTYPPYYEGTLTQAGVNLPPGRVLGVELNAPFCGR